MQTDAYTRLVLSVIALCLLALVGLQLRPAPAPPPAASEDAPFERYQVEVVRLGPAGVWLLKTDRSTGEVWRIRFPAVASGWSLLREAADFAPPAPQPAAPAPEVPAPAHGPADAPGDGG